MAAKADTTAYLIHSADGHAKEAQRLVSILGSTLERRFAPDSAVDSLVEALALELELLVTKIKKLKET